MIEEYDIFGTGSLAKRFYYLNKKKLSVHCFYDNDKNKLNTCIDGISVREWKGTMCCKIIIASSYYREIAKQLIECGLVPFRDFFLWNHITGEEEIDYKEFYVLSKLYNTKNRKLSYDLLLPNKKIAIIYGNCQTGKFERLIRLSKKFVKEYSIVYVPKVFEIVNKQELVTNFIQDDKLWKRIDLLIYQIVSDNNKYCNKLSSNNILKKINKSKCKTICIENIYFDGYFPQYKRNELLILKTVHQSGLFPFGDKIVDEMIKEGLEDNEIINKIKGINIISKDEIIQVINESFERLRDKERKVDVKIVDYLRDNYRAEQLFYSPNHPCSKVIIEYVNRILEYQGYERIKITESDYDIACNTLKGQDIPIYPCVINIISLQKYETYYYPNRYLDNNLRLDFEAYLRLYIETKRNNLL